ncbi:uncharacterized protein PSFLO_05941 [Pseudozyma flocculosa]|nr:uncharacterized protein PSFLO_05941 [Pseudozyma flocculosa]
MSDPESDTGGFSIAKIKRAPQPPKPVVEIPVHDSSDDQGPRASKSQSRKDSSRHPSKKPPTSSSSSKRKAAPSSSSSSTHKGKSKSKHRAEGKASQRLDREGRSKKKKQRRDRASRGSEPDDSDDGDDVSNLKSYLNDDALARSSGSTHKADFRKHLEKMRKDRERLRRRRELLGSEDDDDDDTASGSDDDSDDDDDDSDASGHTSLFGSSVSGSDGDRRRRSSATEAKAKAQAKGKDKKRHKGSSAPRTSSKAPRINDAVDDQSSTPSEWSSEIEDASSDNGASSDPEDFIVGDDLVETEDGKKIRTSKADAAKASGLRRRLHLAGGLGSGGGGVLAAFGLGHARLEFEDLCGLWIEWAVVRMLIPFGNVSAEDRERLERGRGQLRNKMRSAEEALTSSAMRRQFSWYLREYPKVTIKLVFDDEIRKIGGLAKRGCGACHRRNQACSHLVRFEGRRYDQETLGKREPRSDDDSSSESDRSADGENLAESDVDDKNRRAKRFYVGTHCASRASAMHAIHHWEWAVMQGLNRHPAVQRVRDDVEARGGVGIDGSEGPGAEDVELCVREMSDDHAPGGGERQKLVRKLKKLLAEADTVNRLQ